MGRGGGRTKKDEEDELRHAKRGYNEAKSVGNREEEARWANTIGDIHKRRGEYVEALKWLRIDYDISVKYLPQRQVLPSCQSLGEVYLRLDRLSEALTYQKKHLLLAKESDDLVEQQRANTQLGRTYYEILRKNEYDHIAVRNAKKYFKLSMKLARNLKEKSPSEKSGFLRELIDSYNNMGMLELELDNYEDAEKLLIQGLKLCDDEEVNAYDEARTRLHHNLGSVYTALRNWNKAKGHIEKDIEICRKIRHPQGEAKGFVNLGELHSRVQKYEDAKLCYNKALQIAKCLEDEDALMEQIQGNIETVEQAAIVLEELKKDEQKLKKLIRDVSNARGTSNERKLLLEQYKWLDNLATKADKIAAWQKGQALAKVNIGNVLDSYSLLWKQTDLGRNFKPSRICITATWSDLIKLRKPSEAKGFVNLGELHSRVQKYEDAKLCYNKALQIAKCLEDEDALMEQIQGNIETVEQAAIVLEELKKDEQKLKKLIRDVSNARGTSNERKLLLEQYKWLDNLATKADKIAAWQKVSLPAAYTTLERLLPPVEVASRHADQDNFRWQGITDMEGDSGREVVSIEVHFWAFRIGEHLVYLDDRACVHDGAFDIESLKVEVACVYYLQISDDKKVKGLLPVIGELRYCGEVLDDAPPSIDYVDQLASEQKCVDVVIADWVPKRLLKLYVDFCKKLSEAPNKKLLRKLYNLEVSEDEVIVSDCGLQDLSITPFLNALRSHKTIAVLDLSHNLLGNKTIESLQHIFASSSQTYGGLTLDLHCNRFGPTALFQICECAVMTERLEVLNLSGNRLTDACSSYIFTILQKCKALYSLNIEQCSITSRTVQKVADALHEGSVLSHLSLGKNNPISGTAMLNLLSKLASLRRFSELSLTGIKLNKLMVDKLCSLAQSTCLSGFLLGGTSIGPVGTIRLTEVLSCASHELLSIRSLTLDRCNLGLMGIVRIIQALSDNDQLEELRVAGNANFAQGALQYDKDMQEVSTTTDQKQHNNSAVNNDIAPENIDFENMQVPDSEDEADNENHRAGPHGSCASSSQRNQCYQVVEELVHALVSAKQLKVLDLSQNGLSDEVIQSLYSAWASGSREETCKCEPGRLPVLDHIVPRN
ncbi:hypothetical protein PR202_ga02977 [Eleusine coracana subsp. coracana]|uniref:Protein TONSOKU n=1 Tax=Eleusine coracana subsp. coracana TaxID=191504 RepID=A0AAV5BKW3_ELECO|nr:hypothetical protein PR202_ga02977 [Eleusine coracana subsp. coracana]